MVETYMMFIVPNVIGFSGDAVNERQLARALSKHVKLKTYSFIPILKLAILTDRKHFSKVREETNVSILLPSIYWPYSVGIFSYLLGCFILAFIAICKKPQLIYVRHSILALPFLLLKKIHKARVIVKIPALIEDEVESSSLANIFSLDIKIFRTLNNFLERYVVMKADIMALPSPFLYAELIRRRRVKGTHSLVIITPGVDIKKLPKMLKLNEVYRKDKSTILIGFLGSLYSWQGVDILVRAIHLLQNMKKTYKFKLIIVGDGPLKEPIVRLCRNLGVEYVITGFVSHEEALNMLTTFDVLALPRVGIPATIPIKVIEAWALGVPVVISRHKTFEWFGLKDEEDVVYCNPTPKSVAEAILKIIENAELKHRLRVKGRFNASKFSYDTISEKFLRKALS